MNARSREPLADPLCRIAQPPKQVINKSPTKIDRRATQQRFLISLKRFITKGHERSTRCLTVSDTLYCASEVASKPAKYRL